MTRDISCTQMRKNDNHLNTESDLSQSAFYQSVLLLHSGGMESFCEKMLGLEASAECSTSSVHTHSSRGRGGRWGRCRGLFRRGCADRGLLGGHWCFTYWFDCSWRNWVTRGLAGSAKDKIKIAIYHKPGWHGKYAQRNIHSLLHKLQSVPVMFTWSILMLLSTKTESQEISGFSRKSETKVMKPPPKCTFIQYQSVHKDKYPE